MKLEKFVWITLGVSLLFFLISYCFYLDPCRNYGLVFEKALSLTFSFIGSIGTIASIVFAIWLYNSQKESQQPKFHLIAKDPVNGKDTFKIEPYWAIGVNIINYGHQVTSFSVTPLENKSNENIVINIVDSFKTSFDKGESNEIKIIIYNAIKNTDLPEISDLRFTFTINYMDVFNFSHYDEYEVDCTNGQTRIRRKK